MHSNALLPLRLSSAQLRGPFHAACATRLPRFAGPFSSLVAAVDQVVRLHLWLLHPKLAKLLGGHLRRAAPAARLECAPPLVRSHAHIEEKPVCVRLTPT
eukprot:1910582-Pleurochrysis_carterae.AAC.8